MNRRWMMAIAGVMLLLMVILVVVAENSFEDGSSIGSSDSDSSISLVGDQGRQDFVDKYNLGAATFDASTTFQDGVLHHGSVGLDVEHNNLEGASVNALPNGFELNVNKETSFIHGSDRFALQPGDRVLLLEGNVIEISHTGEGHVPVQVNPVSTVTIQGPVDVTRGTTRFIADKDSSFFSTSPQFIRIRDGSFDVEKLHVDDPFVKVDAAHSTVQDSAPDSLPASFDVVGSTQVGIRSEGRSFTTIVQGAVPSLVIGDGILVEPFEGGSLGYVTGGDVEARIGEVSVFYRAYESSKSVLPQGAITTEIMGSQGAIRIGAVPSEKEIVGSIDLAKILN